MVGAQRPRWQRPVAQSPSPPQFLQTAQSSGQSAAQSTSLSPPFLTPSAHVAGAQTPASHAPESQSMWLAQPSPSAQPGQSRPPQSVSVSSPFFSPSAQEGTVPPAPPV